MLRTNRSIPRRGSHWAAGLAASALLVAGPVTGVGAIEWAVDGGGSWADPDNWSPAGSPAGQHVILSDNDTPGLRTVTLDDHWTVDSLTVLGSSNRYNINPGNVSGAGITLTSGYLQLGTWNGDPVGVPQHLQNIYLQIGDGTTPLDTSWWVNSHTGNHRIGEVRGIAGTVINLSGDGSMQFEVSSNDYLGDWNIAIPTGEAARLINVSADNALGHGTVTFSSLGSLLFNQPGTSHAMNLNIQATTHIGASPFNIAPEDDTPTTLHGNLTGTGLLRIGNRVGASTTYPGVFILAGDNNTHSGGVEIRGSAFRDGGRLPGTLQVDGTWTGSGDILTYAAGSTWAHGGWLAGHGTIGLSQDSVIDVDHRGALSAGSRGGVGTLTVGTEGNNNTVLFGSRGEFFVDIDGDSADRLDIIGNLDLSASDNMIEFNFLSDPSTTTAESFTLITYTGWLSGEFDSIGYYDEDEDITTGDLPDGWYLDYSTAGEINLITTGSGPDILVGDMNGDGQIDFDDINPFMLALNDPSAYESQYGLDPNVAGDINDDGQLDFDDINPFVALLSGNGSANVVPEPATLSLLALGGLAALARRRRMA